jgi:hypothetical protein
MRNGSPIRSPISERDLELKEIAMPVVSGMTWFLHKINSPRALCKGALCFWFFLRNVLFLFSGSLLLDELPAGYVEFRVCAVKA